MTEKSKRPIYVTGHINPDSDSICSAIAYANLKRELTNQCYEPCRTGELNNETAYILDYFDVKEPRLLLDVFLRVRDIDIREEKAISGNISLKRAWDIMALQRTTTLAVVDEEQHLEGIITSLDIALANQNSGNALLGQAKTPYTNLLDAIDGEMQLGDPNDCIEAGKILVAAGDEDTVAHYCCPHDLVITGHRPRAQKAALKKGIGCLIICTGKTVCDDVLELAKEKGCAVVTTERETYDVARNLHQSAPVSHFMTGEDLLTFKLTTPVDEVRETMSRVRTRYFPVLDEKDHYCGLISRRNLLNLEKSQVVLVDHNETSQAVRGIERAEVLEVIDHHRIGNIQTIKPIFFRNHPVGSTCTIVYNMYVESDVAITRRTAGLLCAGIISDTLMLQSPTCTEMDRVAAKKLAKVAEINLEAFADAMFAAGSDIGDVSARDLFFSDYKVFENGKTKIGIGQGNFSTLASLQAAEQLISGYLEEAMKAEGTDMMLYMLTNIIHTSTRLLYAGKDADRILQTAFPDCKKNDTFVLNGVVSRKKQVVPPLMNLLDDN